MNRASILGLAAALLLMAATAAMAADKAFLWDGEHWKQVSLDGKAGYIFGMGNLADFEVAAGSGHGRNACISSAFVNDLKNRTVMQIVQEVDKYYQENPGKLSTSVIEVVLRRCTTVCPPEIPGGAKQK
jgi:hypothetical protein